MIRHLSADDKDFSIDLDNKVYALDSTTIDLCLSVFPRAKFRKNKAAVKMHAVIDLRGNITVFIDITDGTVHDVNTLDLIDFEPGAFYVMEKAYVDFERLYEITQILGVSVFNKTPFNELLTNFSKNERNKINYNQLNMFDL